MMTFQAPDDGFDTVEEYQRAYLEWMQRAGASPAQIEAQRVQFEHDLPLMVRDQLITAGLASIH